MGLGSWWKTLSIPNRPQDLPRAHAARERVSAPSTANGQMASIMAGSQGPAKELVAFYRRAPGKDLIVAVATMFLCPLCPKIQRPLRIKSAISED